MQSQEALDLALSVTYKPSWWFEAYVYGKDVVITAYYQVQDSDVRYAPKYERNATVYTSWYVPWALTKEEFTQHLFQIIMEIEAHEAREFFSVGSDFHKPYHPHTSEGQYKWAVDNKLDVSASIKADLAYNQDGLIHDRTAVAKRPLFSTAL